MKREVKLLRQKALDSILLSIEHFNRPFDRGRVHSVLIYLDHAFEMLLKAAILHKGGKIRKRRAKQTIGFDACVTEGFNNPEVRFLKNEQVVSLQTINALRDAAQHYLIDVPEQQLYLHAQTGVTLFADLLEKVFGEKLMNYVPNRVLPVSTSPPTDLGVLLEDELRTIKRLFRPGGRRRIEARSRLRALAVVEAATQGEKVQPSDNELDRVLRRILADEPTDQIFPGFASLALSTDGEGIPFNIRLTKKEGVPVHLVPEGTAGAEVIAVKKVNETGFYSLSHHQVAEQVGLSQPKATAVIRYLKIKENGECFRCFQFGKTKINRYSTKAVEKIKAALPQLDMAAVWKAYTNTGRAA